ncbi:S41 family peptidase [Sphingobacterium griseoflavum]|uniref:Tail specific protease domain-containing protein n=1 Tax=Sphingobacterium griseoflavum TaxID=1474952 RepID=A0ABQ3HUK0_9SPHI|nr:S41 family peptidase [Sphingobacterium griseoflavum]GHE36018.1 hypothetical protein GCM10017764_19230 [Sphingobacterium griseoflavum]
MRETFEKNDAGFQHILDRKGSMAYAAHNETLSRRAAKITDYDECQQLLEDWLKFFRTDHFRLTKTKATQAKQVRSNIWEPRFMTQPIDTVEFKANLAGVGSDLKNIEGIWQNNDITVLVKHMHTGYEASILKDMDEWRAGQLLFQLDEKLQSGTRFMSTFRPVPIQRIRLLDNKLLLVDQLTLKRIYPHAPLDTSSEEFYRLKNSDATFAYKRDEQTVYLRIPSFSFNKRAIDSVLNEFDQVIRTCPNLIIDLRDCQGGQDNNFAKLLPYLSTGSTRTVMAEVRSTQRNNEIWDSLINDPETDEEEKESYRAIQNTLNAHLGEFVNIFGRDVAVTKKGEVLPNPKNVGIIIHENNFSTTEQFILVAKQSRKVKFFGRKTGGALDVSNMVEARSPSGDFIFEYCISRSLRIPEMAVDDLGIHPDFYLDKTVGENRWVDFVSDRFREWSEM